jgi:predicted lactoylglutathione lyase
MTVPARVSLVTLGVADVARSTAFYQAIGWEPSSASVAGDVTFFAGAGAVLAIWRAGDLAADAGADDRPGVVSKPGFRGVALAINLGSEAEVDAAFATAEAAGAVIVKPPTRTEWGGYSGYFADPDGHAWELAHNPFWPLGPDGLPQLP